MYRRRGLRGVRVAAVASPSTYIELVGAIIAIASIAAIASLATAQPRQSTVKATVESGRFRTFYDYLWLRLDAYNALDFLTADNLAIFNLNLVSNNPALRLAFIYNFCNPDIKRRVVLNLRRRRYFLFPTYYFLTGAQYKNLHIFLNRRI